MKKQNVAGIQTVLVMLLLVGACVGVVIWAMKTQDSELAESIRQKIGIPGPEPKEVVVAVPSAPEPKLFVAPEPEPEPKVTPKITFAEVAAQRHLWPKSLTLKLVVQVALRYNEKDYGYMEFPKGLKITVDALMPSGEVFCQIDGNYLSLSVYETDFYGWFKETHGARYDIQPVVVDFGRSATAPHRLGTPEGDAAFWAEMRIWCQQNYESVSLKVEENNLVFAWLPREDAPISFPFEAREIARNYLLKRAKYGGRENYAACEIRHPITNELLGTSAIFIPRL